MNRKCIELFQCVVQNAYYVISEFLGGLLDVDSMLPLPELAERVAADLYLIFESKEANLEGWAGLKQIEQKTEDLRLILAILVYHKSTERE
jgi:hypothetical protein